MNKRIRKIILSKRLLKIKTIFLVTLFFIVVLVILFVLCQRANKREEVVIAFVSDWEYSDQKRIGNKFNFSAKRHLKELVAYFNSESKPDVVIGGGDYVKSSHMTRDEFEEKLKDVMDVFNKTKAKKLYCVGNQDLKKLSKKEVRKILGINYNYTSIDKKGFRLVIMDNNYKIGPDKKYNGAEIGEKELEWLKKEIATEMPVLIFSHYSPIPIPTESGWKKDFHDAEKLTELLEKRNNVIAVVSGNSPKNSVRKESGIPYISVAGLTDIKSPGNFAEIELLLNGDDLKMTVSYKKGESGQIELTRKISDHYSLEIAEIIPIRSDGDKILWHNLVDQDNENGKISELNGTETNLAVSESGRVYVAFQDGKHDNRAHVRMYDGSSWQDLADEKHQKGLLSKQKGGDPYIEINGDDVYVAFMDFANKERARVKKWDGKTWSDVSGVGSFQGFVSLGKGHEPVLVWDKSKKNLYVAFGISDKDDIECRETCQIKVKKWDGKTWSDVSDSQFPNGIVSEKRGTEVDIVASSKDDSFFIVFEDLDNNNQIKVKKWDGKTWSNVSDNFHRDDTATKIAGFSPSLSINQKEELFLVYTGEKNKSTYVTKWNGSNWENMGDGIVSSGRNIESCVAVGDRKTDEKNIYIAYSYFKKNAQSFREREKGGKITEKIIESNRWLVRVERWEGEKWVPLSDQNNPDGLMSKGNGKGDPSISVFRNELFISFTDKKIGNGVVVKRYSEF